MEDNGQNNNFESRLEDVQQSNQIRQDGDVTVRNADMVGARRSDDVSAPFWNRFRSHDTSERNKSPKDNIFSNKSGLLSSRNKNYNNQQISKGNKNNSLSNNNNQKTDNLSFKQRMAKNALKDGASLVPGISTLANSKMGDKILNDNVQKLPFGKKKSLFSFFKPANEERDIQGKSKDNEENSIDNVTVKILTPKVKILLPICSACCVVVFGICIVMVAAQAYISILGIDLSSSITVDSKDVQDKLTSGESNLKNDEIDQEITETSDNT